MASITSMMNSSYNTSSIYGNRNILSGLASGMDTETMIENAVAGIKMKIQGLYQKRTKVEWQQEAYRSIIDKAVNLSNKYTSYTSKTNLLSSSFFNNAVITSAKGTYANKVSATGKTASDVKINAVKQLATAASYTVSGSAVLGGEVSSLTGREGIDLTKKTEVSRVSGILTLKYGGDNGTSFNLNFDEDEVFKDANELANAIREKLKEQTFNDKAGDELIKVEVSDGAITFSDPTGENKVYISSAVGDIKSTLNVTTGDGQSTLETDGVKLSKEVKATDNLLGKTLTFNLNGTSKTIKMDDVLKRIDGDFTANAQFQIALQGELDKAFGEDKIKVSRDQKGVLSFKPVEDGSTLSLSGSAAKALGFENGDANFLSTSKTLRDMLGERDSYDFVINGVTISADGDTTLERLMNDINSNAKAGVKVGYSTLTNEFRFTAAETGSYGKIEFGGLAAEMFGDPSVPKGSSMTSETKMRQLLGYYYDYGSGKDNFTMDVMGEGFSISVGMDTTIDDIVKELNWMVSTVGKYDEKFKGVEASFDSDSGSIVFKNTETGEVVESSAGNKMAEDFVAKLAASVPKVRGTYTAGQDAVMDVEVNGKRFENLTRSSNVFDIDGMSITVKGTFSEKDVEDGKDYEPITFETVTDTDKIIDAVRSFVNDYNEMVTELKGAFSTQPAYKSGTTRYEPLTAEEEEGYSESQLAAYNEKAKQGILFGDTTLSSMYSKLLNAIAPGGADGQTLREIGIGTSYENGLTTISLDEDKLRTTLEKDPDKVTNAFTKTNENGSSSNGMMQNLQNTLNAYVRTTGEPKGALITRAGSVKAPTSLNNNTLQTQLNNIDRQVQRWQDKMDSQIDRYTKQFSKLEQLVAAMNSQASALAGLMGGSEGYY